MPRKQDEYFRHDILKDFIDRYIEDHDMNYNQLARKLGIEHSTISAWLRKEKPKTPDGGTIAMMEDVLGYPSGSLFNLFYGRSNGSKSQFKVLRLMERINKMPDKTREAMIVLLEDVVSKF